MKVALSNDKYLKFLKHLEMFIINFVNVILTTDNEKKSNPNLLCWL